MADVIAISLVLGSIAVVFLIGVIATVRSAPRRLYWLRGYLICAACFGPIVGITGWAVGYVPWYFKDREIRKQISEIDGTIISEEHDDLRGATAYSIEHSATADHPGWQSTFYRYDAPEFIELSAIPLIYLIQGVSLFPLSVGVGVLVVRIRSRKHRREA